MYTMYTIHYYRALLWCYSSSVTVSHCNSAAAGSLGQFPRLNPQSTSSSVWRRNSYLASRGPNILSHISLDNPYKQNESLLPVFCLQLHHFASDCFGTEVYRMYVISSEACKNPITFWREIFESLIDGGDIELWLNLMCELNRLRLTRR